ncbi:MAG: hypothetical protein GC164_02830 [Phycisphaera sp.]|nr:hypothetical protein [Phycisphaera sp.]
MMRVLSILVLLALTASFVAAEEQAKNVKVKPLMKDFIGLNGHTVNFKPKFYAPVARLVRDYHGMNWDTGVDSTSRKTTFPMAHNKVNWLGMYQSWIDEGFEIDACLMFGGFKADQWDDPYEDAYRYGKAFAEYFGPTNGKGLVTSAEVGNEPAGQNRYTPEQYAPIFEGMAKGLREGDPALKILTCTTVGGKPDRYSMPASMFRNRLDLFDVFNVHTYSLVTGWPTWERSYPEDPAIDYLKRVQQTINFRNTFAKGKEVWVTEFGFDACTKPAPKEGTFKDWMDVSDEVQAQWLIRSFLVFSEMDVERAYMFFFNDNDTPQFHGSSGLTREYVPKMAYWAQKHLYQTTGEYRFSKAVMKKVGDLYVYEYVRGDDPRDRIYVAWSPTGGQNSDGASREVEKTLEIAGDIKGVERMPMADGPAPQVEYEVAGGKVKLTIDESPVYIHVILP